MAVPISASGTIAGGGSAQVLLAAPANSYRSYFFFQNNSANPMWLNFVGSDANSAFPSIQIAAGGAYENPPHFCPAGSISLWGTTTMDTFTCLYH